jgi:hypothetical protein
LPDTFTEDAARRVLLLRAFEAGAAEDAPLWTSDDRDWATRLAGSEGATSAPAWLAARAAHALNRLLPRVPEAARALARRDWPGLWLLLVLLGGALLGVAVDAIGGSQRINLLAPPVWAVIGWNGLVYAGLLLAPLSGRAGHGPRRWWAALLRHKDAAAPATTKDARPAAARVAALRCFHRDWAQVAAPLGAARITLLLHLAAAALACGLIAGLYARGLVLDYRAGWQSTFLEAPQVHAVLSTALAPAAAATGLAVPDATAVAALSVGPGQVATGPAAVWIHLYAATLALAVVLPRMLLALLAALRARHLAQRLVLPLHEPYFQRLLLARGLVLGAAAGLAPVVAVLPHATPARAAAALGLRSLLARVLGDAVQLQVAAPVAYGAEEVAALPAAPPGLALRLLLVDLGATPEAEVHGRLLQALAAQPAQAPLLLLADESAFARRFGELPERLAQRRHAWQQLAQAQAVAWLSVNLEQPDLPAAAAALQQALQRGPVDAAEAGR